jgi:CHAD domain-containing protein
MSGERAPTRALVPREIELKFDVLDLAAARGLVEADALDGLVATGPIAVVDITDRYLDTAAGSLQRAGWVARVRSGGGAADPVLALKSAAKPTRGGVHVREELEGPAEPDRPLRDWPESAARDRLRTLAGDEGLLETVVLEQRRRQRRFRDDDTDVEVSLDRVRTVVGDRVVDESLVLELEHKAGAEQRLVAIGRALRERPFLAPSATSKLARSLLAAERARWLGRLPDPAVTKTPGVTSDDLVGEAGRKVLALQLARVLAREPGTREGRDPEELHQMRVATRRMRAAWRVFGDAFEGRATRSIRADLRDLAAALGTVRDLDVLLEGLRGPEPSDGAREGAARGEPGLQPFVTALRRDRDKARRRLVRLLDSPGHGRWVRRCVELLTTPGASVVNQKATNPHHIRDTAASRIWLAYERLRAYDDDLRSTDIGTLHEIRIAGKRLRYAIEFVQEAIGPDVAPLLRSVTDLQDHLGALHDADVAAARARSFLAEQAARLLVAEAEAIGRYVRERDAEVVRLRDTIGPAWRGVAGPSFRRRLGRALACL